MEKKEKTVSRSRWRKKQKVFPRKTNLLVKFPPAPLRPFIVLRRRLIAASVAVILLVFVWSNWLKQEPRSRQSPIFNVSFPPLVKHGGDPYIRALMRTISGSEANDSQPYSILYGGQHIHDLSRHPEQCVTIITGPNRGKCSTAAGRYQLLNTTWDKLAER